MIPGANPDHSNLTTGSAGVRWRDTLPHPGLGEGLRGAQRQRREGLLASLVIGVHGVSPVNGSQLPPNLGKTLTRFKPFMKTYSLTGCSSCLQTAVYYLFLVKFVGFTWNW